MKNTHLHGFGPHPTAPDYEVCESCGSMHRIKNVAHDDVYASGYWDRPGYSTIQEQVHNVSVHTNGAGVTKCEAVLKYAKEGDAALEIACAPGAMLRLLRAKYQHVVGIEYDSRYRQQIAEVVAGHAAVVYGAFPEVSSKWPPASYDFICGMDVFEHIEDGEKFLSEIMRLLKPSGTVVLMMPMVSKEGTFRESDAHSEHVWLYSEKFLKQWFGSNFKKVQFDTWLEGHNIIVAEGLK